jgi:hypothetical protein
LWHCHFVVVVAEVSQEEGAGVVSAFRMAGTDAHLSEQGGLLITGDSCNRDAAEAVRRANLAEKSAGGAEIRQQTGRDAEEFQEVGVPEAASRL